MHYDLCPFLLMTTLSFRIEIAEEDKKPGYVHVCTAVVLFSSSCFSTVMTGLSYSVAAGLLKSTKMTLHRDSGKACGYPIKAHALLPSCNCSTNPRTWPVTAALLEFSRPCPKRRRSELIPGSVHDPCLATSAHTVLLSLLVQRYMYHLIAALVAGVDQWQWGTRNSTSTGNTILDYNTLYRESSWIGRSCIKRVTHMQLQSTMTLCTN